MSLPVTSRKKADICDSRMPPPLHPSSSPALSTFRLAPLFQSLGLRSRRVTTTTTVPLSWSSCRLGLVGLRPSWRGRRGGSRVPSAAFALPGPSLGSVWRPSLTSLLPLRAGAQVCSPPLPLNPTTGLLASYCYLLTLRFPESRTEKEEPIEGKEASFQAGPARGAQGAESPAWRRGLPATLRREEKLDPERR